jgi:hypothetical protein
MPAPPLTHWIHAPTDTVATPLIYAVVANHPVGVQLEHTITFLARLIARRAITPESLEDDELSHTDATAMALDNTADLVVKDLLRSRGWRAAAETLRDRAAADGMPLSVEFLPALLTPEQLRLQAPVLRRVYNESPHARSAVDILATLMSQGMTTSGGSNAGVARFAHDFLDLGLSRNYVAHLVRDALVCGNGYLSYGSVPDEDTRLMLPENVTIGGNGVFIESTPDGDVLHRNVIHMKGATQPGSLYGVSILEPLVVFQIQKEQALHWIARADTWAAEGVPARHLTWAQSLLPLADRTLSTLEEQTQEIFGPVLARNTVKVRIPSDLYLDGSEAMTPAAEAISLAVAGTHGGTT